MKKIAQVEVFESYRLRLTYEDGQRGIVDVSELVGKGVFAAWLDPAVFEAVEIGSNGELVWGDDIELCPDGLYLKVSGEQPADLFPAFLER